ncbi:DUF7351 domain-containing protein [Natronobacterium texcoconense]|uniref:Uncharacterized protein n=1 Tax=Natronobacterium texcoconense TaxID=1095778 RepID=A0A1H1G527_NATTX|nr:helix-turn-helix transcriptional regulator [Natronobacterium texcoconense]SDR08175.1 hypothetical protein SAMN04489842_2260 [Natronobacterium texcoconense]
MVGEDSTAELEETFSVVANDIRLDILWTLWEIYTDNPSPDPGSVPFSTLKDRVGVRDSGQFHYHLDELVPRFVTRHEDGYTLTYAGARIIGAAVSGIYTDTQTTLETTAADSCPDPSCEGELELGYHQGHVRATCNSCEERQIMSAPPILVGAHDVDRNPGLLGSFTLTQLQKTVRGFCHLCSGPVEGSVVQQSLDDEVETGENVEIVYECQECEAASYTAATTAILGHPAVVSLLYDAGIDYRKISPWHITRTLNSKERVNSEDPVRVEVTVSIADTKLTAILDENLTVLDCSEQ